MVKNERRTSLLREVAKLYSSSGLVNAFVDDDGDLMMRSYVSPSAYITSFVTPIYHGYVVMSLFGVGTDQGRSSLMEVINEINRTTAEGCMFVDKEGGIAFRNFVPYSESMEPDTIAAAIRAGTFAFLDNLDDIMDVINMTSGLKECDFRITDSGGA